MGLFLLFFLLADTLRSVACTELLSVIVELWGCRCSRKGRFPSAFWGVSFQSGCR